MSFKAWGYSSKWSKLIVGKIHWNLFSLIFLCCACCRKVQYYDLQWYLAILYATERNKTSVILYLQWSSIQESGGVKHLILFDTCSLSSAWIQNDWTPVLILCPHESLDEMLFFTDGRDYALNLSRWCISEWCRRTSFLIWIGERF